MHDQRFRAEPPPPRYVDAAPSSRPPAEAVELDSEHLVAEPERTQFRIHRYIVEALSAFRPASGPAHAPRRREEVTTQLARVPSKRPWRLYAVAAVAFTLVWNIAIGAYLVMGGASPAPASRDIAPAEATAPYESWARCASTAKARVLAESVLVKGGVEASTSENRLALGVVKTPREGIALELDPATLAVKSSTKVIANDALARVVPSLYGEAPLDAMPEIGVTHVVSAGHGDVYEAAVKDGFLVWSVRDTSTVGSRLWPMTSDVESLRAVPTAVGRMVVFRSDGAIWLGTVKLDHEGARPGGLVRISEAGVQVGVPSIAAHGEEIVAAWAQRDAREPKTARWIVRWARWRRGVQVGTTQGFAAAGVESAIAPSVAVFPDGKFLLAWTEAGPARHRVRAQLIGRDERVLGMPIDVSPVGMDAGQAQLAMGEGGRGTIGYLVARARSFDLVATPITCQ